MVSLYHHFCAFRSSVDLMQMVRDETQLHHGAWHKHVNAWLANPFQAEMLVIRYEDLKQDPVTELERFCAFAGVKRERPLLELVAQETVFEKMQRREMRLGEGDLEWPKNRLFRRRGVIGSYKDEMPSEVLAFFMADAAETLKKCGYLETSKEFTPRPSLSPPKQRVTADLALTKQFRAA